MKKIIIGVLCIILLIFAYWYFIGVAPLTIKINDTMPVAEKVIKQGEFISIDTIHKGSGTAKIVESAEKRLLILQNFKVTNGPDLFVYLSKNTSIKNENDLGDYKILAPLKGNAGNQIYVLSSQDLEYSSVVIWCKRFGVLFSSADLK